MHPKGYKNELGKFYKRKTKSSEANAARTGRKGRGRFAVRPGAGAGQAKPAAGQGEPSAAALRVRGRGRVEKADIRTIIQQHAQGSHKNRRPISWMAHGG